jgi:ATP/ADP translocase
MHVSYWFGTAVGDLLFKGFTVNSASGSHNSMLISFIAVCMEISVFAAGNLQKYSSAEINQMYDHSQQELSSHRYMFSCLDDVG